MGFSAGGPCVVICFCGVGELGEASICHRRMYQKATGGGHLVRIVSLQHPGHDA